ncbi:MULTISPECIES: hypothetical protein [Delftia]|uniref:hypothetical protein n=1 Tax=Delftia TaxID=80865 RepID=UPI000B01C04C|nr:hypothetical protein [Delftia lacustris]
MLSFNNIYGQPAALMRRRIWRGEERKVPGVSVRIVNAFKPVRSVSPVNISVSMGLYSSQQYFLVRGATLYTSPDLKVLTQRLLVNGENANIVSMAHNNDTVIIGARYWTGFSWGYVSYASVDGGITFKNITATPNYVRAGSYFYAISSSMARSATGLDTVWSATAMPPSSAGWSHVLHNGSIYLSLSYINNSFYELAYSENGSAFNLSTNFASVRSKIPSGMYFKEAAVVGRKFVLVGVAGKIIHTIATEDGINFEQFDQYLETGVDGEAFRGWNIQSTSTGDAIYMRGTTSDIAGVGRVRVFSCMDGRNWRVLPSLVASSSFTDPTNGFFALAPGQGIYVTPWPDADHAFISDTVNDRDFYYELGAA